MTEQLDFWQHRPKVGHPRRRCGSEFNRRIKALQTFMYSLERALPSWAIAGLHVNFSARRGDPLPWVSIRYDQ